MVSLPPIDSRPYFGYDYDIVFRDRDQAINISEFFEHNTNRQWVIHEGGPTVTRVEPWSVKFTMKLRSNFTQDRDRNTWWKPENWSKRWVRDNDFFVTYIRKPYQPFANKMDTMDDYDDVTEKDSYLRFQKNISVIVKPYKRDGVDYVSGSIVKHNHGVFSDMSLIVPEFWEAWRTCPIANLVDLKTFKLYSVSFYSKFKLSELYKSTILLDMDLTSFMRFPKFNNVNNNNNDTPRKYNIGPGILRNRRNRRYFPIEQRPRRTEPPFRRQYARSNFTVDDLNIGNNSRRTGNNNSRRTGNNNRIDGPYEYTNVVQYTN
jgi:hypothetical protein